MVRINLFAPLRPPLHGTATAGDILSVSSMPLLFCAEMSLLTYGVLSVLMAFK
jgi:hypothetical protein